MALDFAGRLRDILDRLTRLERAQIKRVRGSRKVLDWNEALTVGNYWMPSEGVNGPFSGWWIGRVSRHEGGARIIQEVQEARATTFTEKWMRYWNGTSWSPWMTGATKILWTGVQYMNATQEAPLSERLTNQRNGIILVWQGYSNGTPLLGDLVYTHVPKWHLTLGGARGVQCTIWPGTSATAPFQKYVYVGDDKILGNAMNSQSPRTSHVLTAVLGY